MNTYLRVDDELLAALDKGVVKGSASDPRLKIVGEEDATLLTQEQMFCLLPIACSISRKAMAVPVGDKFRIRFR